MAQTSGVSDETAYILTTFSFLVYGALVMWMAAGFTMLETGLVRTKNTSAICLKNIALFSIAGLAFYITGYDLMYPGDHPIGILSLIHSETPIPEVALLGGDNSPKIMEQVIASGHSKMSNWFFQMVFVATAASIISGTMAERVKVGPFLVFVVVLTGVLYPFEGQWIWGNGWLSQMGFKDFAGATVVHSVGGWCALTGAIILGARRGKFETGGIVNVMPAANLSFATLGTFILWFGWFGFNAGSHALLGSAADATWMAMIITNTTLSAAAGTVAAMLLRQIFADKMDLMYTLNGAIAGLVAITANPDLTSPFLAIMIGAVGGGLVVLAIPLLEKMRIDDVVGAIPAHLVAGVWGTLAVGIFGGGDLLVQLLGIGAIAAFSVVTSVVVWLTLKFTVGIRVSERAELAGLDKAELDSGAQANAAQASAQREAFPELG